MKQFLLISLLFFSALSFGQFFPGHEHGEKCEVCSGLKSAITQPLSSNPLLNKYDITFTRLNLTSDNNSTLLSGSAEIIARVTDGPMDQFCIELNTELTVDSIMVENKVQSFTHAEDEIVVTLDQSLQENEILEIIIYYKGSGYSGFSHTEVNGKKLSFTDSQPFEAKTWFPCKQVLNDKIDSLHIFITTPSEYKAVSNGLLSASVDLGNGYTRYEWKTKYPIAYYLVAFNICDYEEYTFYTKPDGWQDSIMIQNFMTSQAHIDQMKGELDKTNGVMNLFCQLLGPYPFKEEKYGHVTWGKSFGMEHQTLTSMPYTIDFRRLSHELAHQWFGDLVTCGSWQDIWLNEGFATYFDHLAIRMLDSEAAGKNRMAYYHEKALSYDYGVVYVQPEGALNADRIFNYSLSYCKGAAVMQMLRWEMNNDALFWQTLRNYLDEFSDSSALTTDFMRIVNETSGENYDWFFEQWIYGYGYPKYTGTWRQENDTLVMMIDQTTSRPSHTPFFKMRMPYRIYHNAGLMDIELEQTQNNEVFRIPLKHKVSLVMLDPDNEVLNKNNGISEKITSIIQNDVFINLSIFPIPFSEKLYISTDLDPGTSINITIYDITGNKVLEKESSLQETVLNTSLLKSGVYMVSVRNNNGYKHTLSIKK